ncbi:Baculoviral IAP repeat-containing protein 6 [Nymphon striatum]|nr:Baculoviral IAP repeat-containing protein 6 [Nymphon striatum]
MAAANTKCDEWFYFEDGSLALNDSSESIHYHPNLNIILVITKEPAVKVIDVNSGCLLQKSNLSGTFCHCFSKSILTIQLSLLAESGSKIIASYIAKNDRLLFTDGKAIGLRKDYSGMLLLDTFLQVPVNKADDLVRIELPYAEALKLLKCLCGVNLPGVQATEEFVKELDDNISACQAATKENHKLAKWSTICIELPYNVIKSVCTSLVQELKRINRLVPALSIASAVNERLVSLMTVKNPIFDVMENNSISCVVDRTLMYSEAARKKTFSKWPHMTYKWALPDQMASAGFYHQPNSTGDDRALCFTCNVCLVCWEPTDEPWSEHERHSPSCPFVRGEYTQNVPLSISYATSPAVRPGERMEDIHCVSSSTCPWLMATSTCNGQIIVWDVSKQLRKELQFCIDPTDSLLLSKRLSSVHYDDIYVMQSKKACGENVIHIKTSEMKDNHSQSVQNNEPSPNSVNNDDPVEEILQTFRPSKDVHTQKLCILGSDIPENTSQPRPALVVALSVRKCDFGIPSASNGTSNIIQTLNDMNESSSLDGPLDIMKLDDCTSSNNLYSKQYLPYILVYEIYPEQTASCKTVVNDVPSKSQPSTSCVAKEKDDESHNISDSFYNMCVKPSIDQINDFVAEMQHSFENDEEPKYVEPTSNSFPVYIEHASFDGDSKSMWLKGESDQQLNESSTSVPSSCKAKSTSEPSSEGLLKQCIELPDFLNNERFYISEMVPSHDGKYLLISVCEHEESKNFSDETEISSTASNKISGALLVYRINFDAEVVNIDQVPVHFTKFHKSNHNVKSILVLPLDATDVLEDDDFYCTKDEPGPTGFFLALTNNASIELYRTKDLYRVIEYFPKSGENIVSMAYLSSIDRVCICTDTGNLNFLQLCSMDIISESNERNTVPLEFSNVELGKTLNIRENTDLCKDEQSENQDVKPDSSFLINKPFTSGAISSLYELTEFENLTPRFSVTVPTCWTEIQQEQKQRRHPQHLQQQGEAMQHTRSWRLQTDGTTWDEHLFELSLSRPCCVGHIDFKFNLHPCFNTFPKIEVTLLKQLCIGMNRQMNFRKTSTQHEAVDSSINFNIKSPDSSKSSDGSSENPVLSEKFLENYCAEILCGPVDLHSCIDMSGQSGIITLSSPALLKSKCRTFLLHIKALNVDKENSPKPESSINSWLANKQFHKKFKVKSKLGGNVPTLQTILDNYTNPGTTIDSLATNAANKKFDPKGCDWFHEVSITIRRSKKTNILYEKFQRCSILETVSFHRRLVSNACGIDCAIEKGTSYNEVRHTALDLLTWVAAIQMYGQPDQCNKLINSEAEACFSYSVLGSLCKCLPYVINCKSSGAIKWFFLLLNRVKHHDVPKVGQIVLSLLNSVSKQMKEKENLYHSLLKARFGLYGTPFDPELFELESPTLQKASSTQLSYASVLTGANSSQTHGSSNLGSLSGASNSSGGAEEIDLRDLLNQLGDKNSLNGLPWLPQNQQMTGLLEVEPLHFVCHAASDGTKMEKIESGTSTVISTSNLMPLASSSWHENSSIPDWCQKMIGNNNDGPPLSSLVTSIQQKQEQLLKLKKLKQIDKQEKKLLGSLNETGSFNSPLIGNSSSNYQPPPTPKTTPLFMTPPLTPPSENTYIGNTESDASLGPPVVKLMKPPNVNKDGKDFTFKTNEIAVISTPWHHLLQPPAQQMLVVERMHSGARRFVVLDFGHPILLTDLIIPCCHELVSLSVDVWVQSEETDGQRLIVSTDIGARSLIMNDLHPPTYCRYLKITIIGRYGMNTTRCRIPIGYFYGHTYILPWEQRRYQAVDKVENNVKHFASFSASEVSQVPQIQAQITMLNALQEDIQCRYSLACNKLQTLLQPYVYQESGNSGHTFFHLQNSRFKHKHTSSEDLKIHNVYDECMQLQKQLNLVCQAIVRLQPPVIPKNLPEFKSYNHNCSVQNVCSDKLRVIADCLLDSLVGLTCSTAFIRQLPCSLNQTFDRQTCSSLFFNLCMNTSCPTQLNAITLLVRTCAVQQWWGDFLASTFQSLYMSNNNNIFPQDRVFILLTYLGQKSLYSSGCCTVFESFLNLLSSTLEPVYASEGQRNVLRGQLDLPFLGWILLFLSSCLDASDTMVSNNSEEAEASTPRNKDGRLSRWAFIQSDLTQKNGSTQSKGASSRSYRKKLQKRLMHHKQKLEELELTKKAFLASTKAMAPMNSNIGGSLEAALKLQEEALTKTLKQHQSKHFKDMIQMQRNEVKTGMMPRINQTKNDSTLGQSNNQSENDDKDKPLLNYDVCLSVARRLIALLLHMDFTSSIDLYILACKVLAKVVTSTKPSISLSNLITEVQLQQLMFTAVKNSQCHFSDNLGHQWVSHSILCLLLDIMEGGRQHVSEKSTSSLPDEDRLCTSVAETDEVLERHIEKISTLSIPVATPGPSGAAGTSTATSSSSNSNNNDISGYIKELPMLIDSDDSSDEYSTDLNNSVPTCLKEKSFYSPSLSSNSMNKKSTGWTGLYNSLKLNNNFSSSKDLRNNGTLLSSISSGFSPPLTVSAAMDSRLEQGVETFAELRLKIMASLEQDTLHRAIHSNLPASSDGAIGNATEDQSRHNHSLALADDHSIDMLSSCFDAMFAQLPLGNISFESLLTDSDLNINIYLNDPNFFIVLSKFFSGSSFEKGPKVPIINVGPMVIESFQEFLSRLQTSCYVMTPGSLQGKLLKEFLLKLIRQLVGPDGAISCGHGPLDAQGALIQSVANLNFEKVEINVAIDVIEYVMNTVHNCINHSNNVNCGGLLHSWVNASTCFGGIFSGMLGGNHSTDKESSMTSNANDTRDSLLCSLLKLVNGLVKVPLDGVPSTPSNNSGANLTNAAMQSFLNSFSNSSQTDEHKTACASQSPIPNCSHYDEDQVPCLADKVLSHQPIVDNLLSSLSKCSGSNLAIIIGSEAASASKNETTRDLEKAIFDEPVSVGDAVFHLLCTLNAKTSNVNLILQPVYMWLSTTLNTPGPISSPLILSEPLLWFLLRLLDCPVSLNKFYELGGIQLIAESLVRCHSLLYNSHPSLVSIIMQYLSHRSTSILATPPPTSKKYSDYETFPEGFHNFAPLGSITSSNHTAQSADFLINSVPPHPRARSAAWSYHFYPEERWVDLTITLPCAVLLHEIQIQPHITTLATCPSAVSLDISRGGCSTNFIPVCNPQPTSGLTFIRISLSKPEIVTAVRLRFHKPIDSSNMGLSQILLIGTTTFSESLRKNSKDSPPSEGVVSRSSLGWLRLLHHCMTCHPQNEDFISAASSVQGLIESCCALLQTPALFVYLSHIEKVLLMIGKYDDEMGLAIINILLKHSCWTLQSDYAPQADRAAVISATDAIMNIMYTLCTSNASVVPQRVQALLTWLNDIIRSRSQSNTHSGIENPQQPPILDLQNSISPGIIHCIAAILWQCHEMNLSETLSDLLYPNFLRSLCKWSTGIRNVQLRQAFDSVLCSVCYIKPEYFQLVLNSFGLTFGNKSSMTDQQKNLEASSMFNFNTDDYKEAYHFSLHDFYNSRITSESLSSLAIICQSPPIIKQLLESEFMTVLAQVILDYCSYEISKKLVEKDDLPSVDHVMTDSDKVCQSASLDSEKSIDRELVVSIIQFFTKIANDSSMRNWLGGPDGSNWWLPLLTVLCDSNSSISHSTSVLNLLYGDDCPSYQVGSSITRLENASIDFLSTCCWCHPFNQELVAKVLCQVICKKRINQSDNAILGISGFTRRLILQLLLENEKILVYIKSPISVLLHKPPAVMLGDRGLAYLHPQFGCGHNVRTIYVSTQITCVEIISSLFDASVLTSSPSSDAAKNSEKSTDKSSTDKSRSAKSLLDSVTSQMSYAAGNILIKIDIDSCKSSLTALYFFFYVFAAVSAKDKRQKDTINAQKLYGIRPPTRRGNACTDLLNMASRRNNSMALYHDLLPSRPLSHDLTIAQLLFLLQERGNEFILPHLTLSIKKNQNPDKFDEDTHDETKSQIADESLLACASLPTTLQVFANMGGLSLLAQHLPLLYPEISRQISHKSGSDKTDSSKMPNSSIESDWVKVDAGEDMFDDFPELPPGSSSTSATPCSNSLPPPSIPPYSLAAFGLFLRLPGYADVLLKERQKAQCLLRLALGVTDDADGSDIFNRRLDPTLPTLPFTVLQQLFEATLLTTDDGLLLRKMALDVGVVHLLLACLSVLSHQNSDITLPGFQHEVIMSTTKATPKSKGHGTSRSDDKGHLYWAKGTGFGTGSTTQSWDVEQHILRQRSEEEHVTCLLLVLASYINPGGQVPANIKDSCNNDRSDSASLMPSIFAELLTQSCLLPAMSSYLRNDSVLDMAKHVPLYQSLLKLLRALASSPQLITLLLPQEHQSENSTTILSICNLLSKMKTCVDTYATRLKTNKMKWSASKGKGKRSSSDKEETDEETEGLALLIPDIQETAGLVAEATKPYLIKNGLSEEENESAVCTPSLVKEITRSVEERYVEILKKLQFDSFEMLTEDEDGMHFTIPYHFESNMRAGGDHGHPARARRLAQETVTLNTSLPLSYNSSVFVRCDQDRLDIMKVLITGPSDTPYANGCFEFDVYFPPDYPNTPMLINLETTGHHTVRFNPNLYNDGKVCLSILNTWHGRPEEKWNSNTSSFLQVLVSIQSLILVADPYFNEPGYERSRGTQSGNQSSREYDANIRQATVKWAILEQLRNPCPCFRTIIHKHLWMKRGEVLKQCDTWIANLESTSSERRSGKTSISLNTQALKRHTAQLREEFAKMKAPEGLEKWTEEMTSYKVGPPSTKEETSAHRKEEQVPCMNGDLSPEEAIANVGNSKLQYEICDVMCDLPLQGALITENPNPIETDNEYLEEIVQSTIGGAHSTDDKESIC